MDVVNGTHVMIMDTQALHEVTVDWGGGGKQVISLWYEVAPSEIAPLQYHQGDVAKLFE